MWSIITIPEAPTIRMIIVPIIAVRLIKLWPYSCFPPFVSLKEDPHCQRLSNVPLYLLWIRTKFTHLMLLITVITLTSRTLILVTDSLSWCFTRY